MPDAKVEVQIIGSGGITTGGGTTKRDKEVPKGLTAPLEAMKKNISNMIGPLTAITGVVAGVALVVSAINGVSDKISKMSDRLREVSARLSSLDKIQKKTLDLVLKPFGDFIATLARPYIQMMRTVARESIRKSREVLRAEKRGDITSTEAQAQLMQIMAATSLAMEPLKRGMLETIGPLSGFMSGLEDTEGLIGWFEKAGKDLSDYIGGIISSAALKALPDTWKLAGELLGTAVSDNATNLGKLPSLWSDAYEKFKDLPTKVGNTATGLEIFRSTISDMISGTPGSLEAFNAAVKDTNDKIAKTASNLGIEVDKTIKYFPSTNPFSNFISSIDLARNAIDNFIKSLNGGSNQSGGGFDLMGGISRTFGPMLNDLARDPIGTIQKSIGKALGVRGYAMGGVVPNTGLAYLHQGEEVIPANQTSSKNASFVNNFYGGDSDMVNKIKMVLRDELNRSGIYG